MLIKLSQVYLKLQDEHNIPAADFPDVDVMREKLKKYKPKSEYIVNFNINCCRFDFSKFSAFNKSLIAKVDQMISEVCRICLFGSFNCQLVANKSVQDVPRIMSLIPAEDIKKKSVGGGLIQGGVFEKVLHISLPGG